MKKLSEIIGDLGKGNTESALSWSSQNSISIQENNGTHFVFKLHKTNLLKLFHKAVNIHFELNYKHLSNKAQSESPMEDIGSSLVDYVTTYS